MSSIPKIKLEKFSQEQLDIRTKALATLLTNQAFCFFKKKAYEKAIKAADSAIEADPTHAKAYFRKAQVWKEQNEFEKSTESFKQAIKLAPQDKAIRDEFKAYVDYKTAKEKQWNSKMMGFFDKAEVREQMA